MACNVISFRKFASDLPGDKKDKFLTHFRDLLIIILLINNLNLTDDIWTVIVACFDVKREDGFRVEIQHSAVDQPNSDFAGFKVHLELVSTLVVYSVKQVIHFAKFTGIGICGVHLANSCSVLRIFRNGEICLHIVGEHWRVVVDVQNINGQLIR
jgi:hypothetical protein